MRVRLDDRRLGNRGNDGALPLRPRTAVPLGDKVIGTDRSARHMGGLQAGRFLETCIYRRIGAHGARPCMTEGLAGHAGQADIRVRRRGG